MKAVNHYLKIEPIKEGPKKVGGLILTDEVNEDNRYIKAKVISIGNLVEGINEGDVVYYDKHAGFKIEIDEEIFLVIKQQDVVIVLCEN